MAGSVRAPQLVVDRVPDLDPRAGSRPDGAARLPALVAARAETGGQGLPGIAHCRADRLLLGAGPMMTPSPQPPGSGAAPDRPAAAARGAPAEDAFLIEYLRQHSATCPMCGYELHALTPARCPA